jgi:hypothetical protein
LYSDHPVVLEHHDHRANGLEGIGSSRRSASAAMCRVLPMHLSPLPKRFSNCTFLSAASYYCQKTSAERSTELVASPVHGLLVYIVNSTCWNQALAADGDNFPFNKYLRTRLSFPGPYNITDPATSESTQNQSKPQCQLRRDRTRYLNVVGISMTQARSEGLRPRSLKPKMAKYLLKSLHLLDRAGPSPNAST